MAGAVIIKNKNVWALLVYHYFLNRVFSGCLVYNVHVIQSGIQGIDIQAKLSCHDALHHGFPQLIA